MNIKFLIIVPLFSNFMICCNQNNQDTLSRKNQFIQKINAQFKAVDYKSSGKEQWKYIVTDELSRLSKSDSKEHIIVDARNNIEYRDSHIPTSISIPASKISKKKLPYDNNMMIIFYCNGPKCTKSKKAATKAYSIGYTNIYVYNEGIPEWKKQHLPTEGKHFPKIPIPTLSPKDLEENRTTVFLIDLRDTEEFNKGTIPGTKLNAPLDKIDLKLSQIPKNKPIVIFDHIGKQTLLGGRLLKSFGYDNIKRLEGGWVEWIKYKSDKKN